MGDPKCTHVVVDDANVTTLPQGLLAPNSDTSVVKSEWFWASIQVKNLKIPSVIPNQFDKGSSSHQFFQALLNTEQYERNCQCGNTFFCRRWMLAPKRSCTPSATSRTHRCSLALRAASTIRLTSRRAHQDEVRAEESVNAGRKL
jgi:hypothetical protein